VQVFPAFIATTRSGRFSADVARREAACLRVHDAADADPLPASAWIELQADPARLGLACVHLHPGCAWLSCTHAVADLWLAHMRAVRPELAELDHIDIDAAQDVLAWRDPAGRVQVAALPSVARWRWTRCNKANRCCRQ
jgi:hypothetical protein